MAKPVRTYSYRGLAGCVTQFISRATGTLVGIYHGVQAGIEADPETPWVVLCERHSTLISMSTLAHAHRTRDPREFCDDCREMPEGSIANCKGCAVHYTRETWAQLELVGLQSGKGQFADLELRRCPCETALAVPTSKKIR